MQTKTIISILTFLGASSAAVIPRQEVDTPDRSDSLGQFEVTDFSVATEHGSETESIYTFTVSCETASYSGGGVPSFPATECNAQNGNLPLLSDADISCANENVTGVWAVTESGYSLTINHSYNGTSVHYYDTGFADFPKSDLKTSTDDDGATHTYIDAPGSFVVPYNGSVTSL